LATREKRGYPVVTWGSQTGTWRIKPGAHASPFVIGHRGNSIETPENTIEAFQGALDAGADGVELDVRLTKDNEVAVIHDRRVDRTTDGQGTIGSLTLAELKKLDAGSWFSAKFQGLRVPTLDEVFDALPGSFLINVELKVHGHAVVPLASRVAEAIRRHSRIETTLVASFNPLALASIRWLEPRIPRGFIWSSGHPLPLLARWLSFIARPHWMNPDRRTLNSRLLERFHRQGKPVLAWDWDAREALQSSSKPQVDAIVTDDPKGFARQRA